MQKKLLVGAFALLVGTFGLAPSAGAATLDTASLTVTLAGGSFTFPNAGSTTLATGTATSPLDPSLDAGSAFAGLGVLTLPTTGTVTLISFQINNNGGAAFTGAAPGTVGGTGAFFGNAYIGLVVGGGLNIPLTIGVNPATLPTIVGPPNFTLDANGWTAGTAAVTGIPTSIVTGHTPGSFNLPNCPPFCFTLNTTVTLTQMGNNGLDANGVGTITLVSATRVTTSLSASPVVPSFAFLTLTYVPEPGTLLLLGSGVAGLALLGRRRDRK